MRPPERQPVRPTALPCSRPSIRVGMSSEVPQLPEEPGQTGGRERPGVLAQAQDLMTCSQMRSDNAAIVRDGFNPSASGTIAPSTT